MLVPKSTAGFSYAAGILHDSAALSTSAIASLLGNPVMFERGKTSAAFGCVHLGEQTNGHATLLVEIDASQCAAWKLSRKRIATAIERNGFDLDPETSQHRYVRLRGLTDLSETASADTPENTEIVKPPPQPPFLLGSVAFRIQGTVGGRPIRTARDGRKPSNTKFDPDLL